MNLNKILTGKKKKKVLLPNILFFFHVQKDFHPFVLHVQKDFFFFFNYKCFLLYLYKGQ